MTRFRILGCRCLMFLGLLLLLPGLVVQAAPVPPTECDELCRDREGPFYGQAGDDASKPNECWRYKVAVCNNCQTNGNCFGASDSTKPSCQILTRLVAPIPGGVPIPVPVETKQQIFKRKKDGSVDCRRLCQRVKGGRVWQEMKKGPDAQVDKEVTVTVQKCTAPPPPVAGQS